MCRRTLPDISFFPLASVSIIGIDPKILLLVWAIARISQYVKQNGKSIRCHFSIWGVKCLLHCICFLHTLQQYTWNHCNPKSYFEQLCKQLIVSISDLCLKVYFSLVTLV